VPEAKTNIPRRLPHARKASQLLKASSELESLASSVSDDGLSEDTVRQEQQKPELKKNELSTDIQPRMFLARRYSEEIRRESLFQEMPLRVKSNGNRGDSRSSSLSLRGVNVQI